MDLQFPNMVFTVVDVNYLDKFKENMKKYDDYIKLTPLGQDLTVALFYMNIKNVNKAYAILELLLHVDFKEKDLIVVGDSIKDVEMLKLNCDTAAMINGEIEAKEAAKEITEFDNNHDGACKYVNKILGLNI
jgi:hydroxymethylpyrimidine pyrophosphatase-like HAD family hydrolase